MIPYDVDPSLHTGEPVPAVLEDGFSPPPPRQPAPAGVGTEDGEDGPGSPNFLGSRSMATHPVEPEPLSPGPEPATPNPSHLPVQPEFAPMLPPAEPEDPRVKPPTL